jgi:pimeloyl-ACP methyl ester carboxylesterase
LAWLFSRGRNVDLRLPSGRLHAARFGFGRRKPVVCLPGLAASLHSFDSVAARLAGLRRQVLAIDLHGRGLSTPAVPGTYGWDGHAADVLAASSRIGFERFALVGHSMGALVGLVVARRAPQRLRAVVLIDAVTTPDPAAGRALITTGRVLNASYPSRDRFMQAAREVIVPWNRRWDRYFDHDLERVGGTVRSRYDRVAVLADTLYASLHDASTHWKALQGVPTLVLRARQPIEDAHVISDSQLEAFVAKVPHAVVRDVEANHYGIVMHPDTGASIRTFLNGHAP